MSYYHQQRELEPCLARLGMMPEDKPSFVREVHEVEDMDTLRHMVIRKERERQSIANDLDVAARLGLVISETNEAIQIKLAQLERENQMLHDELRIRKTSTGGNSSENGHQYNEDLERIDGNGFISSQAMEEEQIYLTQELEQARRELTKFRREMDGLSAQLNDMASEMVDSRARVGMYAKRLAEVEHKLATTREVNANLQLLLERALTNQKQSSSTTSHLVKSIQMDLTRVVAENDKLRARIAELEHQQLECEERITTMVTQAQEYASLLEQAQDTIHSLSEPRLSDDDTLSNAMSTVSVSSQGDGGAKETEITKGPVFSAEFRQEMQKEIERNLALRNELRHRIITHDSVSSDKKKTQEGLKYLLSERDSGLTSLSPSSSSHTTSSFLSNMPKLRDQTEEDMYASQNSSVASTPGSVTATMNALRPANFLTGFNSFGSESSIGMGNMGTSSFITRTMPPRIFTASRNGQEPSISTRFFQRLATRLDQYDKKPDRS
ncbi:hypothetical protein PHYBLDRAFT_162774 [Phycomyces blakesleeanus NRRL 1555(-)]|uniref:HAP1 N-terminal domain-containing protein n=1 Tax=Phycomyces blakesleeanus (strain ATCC 8743b / DSM 1359 / FGSC 10004 / NBRC 33097 / NRRL 1555) TaxID=763407 RepID=A0A167QHS9_PHYB8|nr:hypothetical protein PHYBLDRAFT_162774 [Phycomyces blakesleeanus NRRL 1555(-)]OAD79717.1 hypothetical protein PHYBLDRAFT_162774 [Phycomyces blakesleeanus NRRL 1555(-)]|eukprot:XP_018297757.1 hypothetical protein PHYBLDRAFT_162774 [Phycomyces blakesleeanus NRRL 1555(-)]